MGTISYTVPVAGTDLNSVADPEISTALTTIKTWANGNIDAVNLSTTLAQTAGINLSGQVVKGSTVIAGTQTTTSASYTTLSTADQVTGLVLPAGGLIAVWYQAIWNESVAGTGRAAIFIGTNQLKVPGVQYSAAVTQAAATGAGSNAGVSIPLGSCSMGLVSSNVNSGAYSGDVTTGQAQGIISSAYYMELNGSIPSQTSFAGGMPFGGPVYIDNLSAGTYSISVQFKTSSGTLSVGARRLRAMVLAFS